MNIAVLGGSGRIGQLIIKLAEERGHAVVGSVSSRGNLLDLLEDSDIVIDFSAPDATMQLLQINQNTPLVIGTTGLSDEHFVLMQRQKNRVFYSANMSVEVAIIEEFLIKYSKFFAKYDANILEIHHKCKKDSPSGTAVMLGNAIGKNVAFQSQRCGNIVGIHEISFTNKYNRLSIKHESYSKELFANGAIDIAEWLLTKQPGFYQIRDYISDTLCFE